MKRTPRYARNDRGSAILRQAKRERHFPRGNPVGGKYHTEKQRGRRLPRWRTHGHADDEGAGIGTKPQTVSNVTKEKLMGLCMVVKRCNIPPIWTEVEGCKSDRDLRVILQTHWEKNKRDLNSMFYDVYWGEELMKTICMADFTRSNRATFLTSEMGLSFLLLVSRTEDEVVEMEAEWKQKRMTGKKVTTADYKAAEKSCECPHSGRQLIKKMTREPTHVKELVVGEASSKRTLDASGEGAGDVWLPGTKALAPVVWEVE